MRSRLIKKIVDLSSEVDDDDLDWVNWNLLSNDELLERYVQLRLTQYIMENQQ